jgi:hypothetical protein
MFEKYDDGKMYDPPEGYVLSDEDVKAVKSLERWGRKYAKHNLGLFADNGSLKVTKRINGAMVQIARIKNIPCDGGEPDHPGTLPNDAL